MHAIPERLRGVFTTRCYTNPPLPSDMAEARLLQVRCLLPYVTEVCLEAVTETGSYQFTRDYYSVTVILGC